MFSRNELMLTTNMIGIKLWEGLYLLDLACGKVLKEGNPRAFHVARRK
jgi:hypothetical protein